MSDATWGSYLRNFHEERPGITEDILGKACDGDESPYEWAVKAFGTRGPVLDLACGSAPLHWLIPDLLCIGVDSSPAELSVAAREGAMPLILALSSDIPLTDDAVFAVVCSMALQVLEPLDRTLKEVARVLRPGGIFVALLPASSPLSFRDRIRYARLLVALRVARLGYPNDDALTDPVSLLQPHGLDVVSDERRRFRLTSACRKIARPLSNRSTFLPGQRSTDTARSASPDAGRAAKSESRCDVSWRFATAEDPHFEIAPGPWAAANAASIALVLTAVGSPLWWRRTSTGTFPEARFHGRHRRSRSTLRARRWQTSRAPRSSLLVTAYEQPSGRTKVRSMTVLGCC